MDTLIRYNKVVIRKQLAERSVLLRGLAVPGDKELQAVLEDVTGSAPLRHMETPGGYRMSVAMTNCGELGWVSDRSGYRYVSRDPLTGKPWPAMPETFLSLAASAAAEAGFAGFVPDVCLVNRYEPRARLSLHRDQDEKDFSHPIVSVSLGVSATFLFGGLKRKDRPERILLQHGDVVVWGGPDRLRYHGVTALKRDQHPFFGNLRYNLTFRKAG